MQCSAVCCYSSLNCPVEVSRCVPSVLLQTVMLVFHFETFSLRLRLQHIVVSDDTEPVEGEQRRTWKDSVAISLESLLTECSKIFDGHNKSHDRGLNSWPPECEAEAQATLPRPLESCEVWGSGSRFTEVSSLLECDTMSLGELLHDVSEETSAACWG